MKKIADTNMELTEITKYSSLIEADEAFNMFKYDQDARHRMRLANTMLKWRFKKHAETVTDFCDEYNIDRDHIYYLARTYEDFRRYFTIFKRTLANKDLKGAKHRQFDKDVVMKYIHLLDDDWKEINKYHADLKNTEASISDKIFIEIPHTTVETKTDTENKPSVTIIGDEYNDETGRNQSGTLTD
jgi:hypothetical protein